MPEKYNQDVKKILTIAQQEAHRMFHTYIGSEHIMLSIIKDDSGKAANTLKTLGCDLETLKDTVENQTKTANKSILGNLPLTRRAERIINTAYSEAKSNGHELADQNFILFQQLIRSRGTIYKRVATCIIRAPSTPKGVRPTKTNKKEEHGGGRKQGRCGKYLG